MELVPRTAKQALLSQSELKKRLLNIERITKQRKNNPERKTAANAACRKYYWSHREEVLEQQRSEEYREKARPRDREKYKRHGHKQRAILRERYASDEEFRRALAERNMEKKYGFGFGGWEKLYQQQGGICLGCCIPLPRQGRGVHVDHCHTIHRVRGLLCSKCNSVLGLAYDSIPVLTRLIHYLHRCHQLGGVDHDHFAEKPGSVVRSNSQHGAENSERPVTGDYERDNDMAGKLNRKDLMRKLAEAQANGVGNNFKDGKYRLAIKKMGLEDGFKGTHFKAILTVMNCAPVQSVFLQGPNQGQLVNAIPNAVGSDVDWLATDLSNPKSVGPGNVKRLMLELFGRKELSDEEYLETLAEMCDIDAEGEPLKEPLNLARGMVIDMETVRLVTKEKKVEIVVCKWSHLPQTEEQQAQVSEWLNTVTTQMQQMPQGASHPSLPSGATA